MKKTAFFLVLASALLLAGSGWAAEPNYCRDEDSWAEWHRLLADNPADDGIYGLYALRRGLCGMVESGAIDETRATRIFEAAREELVGKRLEEERLKRSGM